MQKSTTFVYEYNGGVYVNLTNRCPNACTFCIRNNADSLGGKNLWLEHEPTSCEVIAHLKAVLQAAKVKIKEIVFCGYGEPTYRLDQVIEVSKHARMLGLKTRLNTNGLGNTINNTDITPMLKGVIDKVSISLNASNSKDYQVLCLSEYGENAFTELLLFAKRCVEQKITTILSVVDVMDKLEIEKCKAIAAKLGAQLRIRKLEVV